MCLCVAVAVCGFVWLCVALYVVMSSMGAATALLHGHRDPSIAAMVLDSPFADLKQLSNVCMH